MKKIILIVCSALIIFSGCAKQDSNQKLSELHDVYFATSSNGDYLDLENGGVEWEMNGEMALEIGNAVLESIYGAEIAEYDAYSVCYIEKKEVYLVIRSLGKDVLGGCFTVAISKKNGEILKVWSGE